MRAGDVATLRLSENAAGGYRWTVVEGDDAHVAVARRGYETTNPAVGSAGTAVFTLTAKSLGTSRIALKKSRPWEPADSASQTFSITVNVD